MYSGRARPGPTTARSVTEVSAGGIRRRPDRLVTEEPLEIRVAWPGRPAERLAVTLRTPGADFELAAGFLLAEGLLRPDEAPRTATYCLDGSLTEEQRYNVVTVELAGPPARLPAPRFGAVTSACGVCGTRSLDEVFTPDTPPLPVTRPAPAELVAELPNRLRTSQQVFAATGSVHAAGVFTFDGVAVVVREDVGRHNAVDKVVGARVLGSASYGAESILCVSGRIGFDIAVKAAAARIPLLVGVGGPSSLAVGLADRAGITVCGFARSDRFVVYTSPERVSVSPAS